MISENNFDFVVIGGGIVGFSTAVKIQKSGKSVLVLEKEKTPGFHQSGRNSGVIHSGIYYKPNSFKSQLSIKGRELLIEFLNAKNIPFRLEGKLVVDNNIQKIEDLLKRSKDLNMEGVKILRNKELLEKEPNSIINNALFVPQAGVVNYRKVTEALAEEFVSLGGKINYFEEIISIDTVEGRKILNTKKSKFQGDYLINCGGLYSDKLAIMDGLEPNVRIIPFRGEYYTFDKSKSNLVNNMIYPIADPNLPFLGIHLTKTIDGNIEAGPNAVFAFAKEGYKWTNINFKETFNSLTYIGMLNLGKKYFKTGISEMYRSLNKKAFVKEVNKLIPGITIKDLQPRGAGVRAQAVDKDGNLVDDFLFQEGLSSLHVLNAPSPAATACLAIGEHIANKVNK
ncbi:MAG: L-2-hydroxyglutarate oxidase [Actinomycetota bacterium]|nr:L-2-hydroxyglutarate oxidase [Actinomycetota bacterium]|tara:strand:- start:5444 stop:6631 length:1188 start_codon:yes stop_codon:yes gene_type:complete